MNDRLVNCIFIVSISLLFNAKCLEKNESTAVKLVDADIDNLTKIEWSDSSGKKQVLVKEGGKWYYAGMEAVDSINFNAYLKTLVSTTGSEFIVIDPFVEYTMLEKLVLFGNNMVSVPKLIVYTKDDTAKPFLIHTSIYSDKFFLSDSNEIYRKIFLNLRQFWLDGQ